MFAMTDSVKQSCSFAFWLENCAGKPGIVNAMYNVRARRDYQANYCCCLETILLFTVLDY